jgi:hypothetical protein
MDKPVEIAKQLWVEVPQNRFAITNEHGHEEIFVQIDENGWVVIDDDACGSGAGCPPEDFEKICKRFLGIE